MPHLVTLSEVKGLSLGREMLRGAQHDRGVTLSAAKGLTRWAERSRILLL